MTSSPSLPVLRQLLNEATPGEWVVPNHWRNGVYVDQQAGELRHRGSLVEPADAALIVAAVNHLPALLDLVERQAAAIEAVQELHRPLMNSPEREPACPDCLGGINVPEDEIDEPRPCGCWGLLTPICGTCADFHGNRRYLMQWPCPTAQALSGITPTTEENP